MKQTSLKPLKCLKQAMFKHLQGKRRSTFIELTELDKFKQPVHVHVMLNSITKRN